MLAHTRGIQLYVIAHTKQTYADITFYLNVFIFFYPWHYILNGKTCRKTADVLSIAAQLFVNLFWKTCPLFGQVLITCLKFSRASFLLFSYSEKMRWGQGWCIFEAGLSRVSECLAKYKWKVPDMSDSKQNVATTCTSKLKCTEFKNKDLLIKRMQKNLSKMNYVCS